MDYFMILDSTRTRWSRFDQEDEACDALERIVDKDPGAADEYAIVRYDATGHPVGDAVSGSELYRLGHAS